LYSKSAILLICSLLVGCGTKTQPMYQNAEGFRFTPPAGWVERMRDDLLPVKATHHRLEAPLPALDTSSKSGRERLLVRYDRLTAGRHAWLRVSVAEAPASVSLQSLALSRIPNSAWKAASEPQAIQGNGWSAARATFAGKWSGEDFESETVAIRHNLRVYLITSAFPASDVDARDQVRQAVAKISWQ
jgi:hypothetical protein